MNETDIFEANGARFYADGDMVVAWIRRTGQQFEPSTTVWLTERLHSASGAFLDIGAATGWFAIPAALSGRHVIAVEANPRVQKRLIKNIQLNRVAMDTVFVAATDKAGPVTFTHNPRLELTSGGSLESNVHGNIAAEPCEGKTIDSIVGARHVSVMKIDVEGHELKVLAGAKATIDRCRPFIAMEGNTPAHIQQLTAWCAANGYDTGGKTYDRRNLLCAPIS